MLSIFCSAFFFFFTLFLQEIKINFWECWASCFLQRFLQCFPVKAEFLSGVLTGNSPQWAKCFSLNSILHNLSGMLCNHFMGQTVTLHSLQGTWQTQVVKLNFPSRRSQWAMTLCRRFVHFPRNLPLSGIPRAGIWGLLVFVCSPVVPDVKPCLSQSAPAPPLPPAQSGAWVSVSVSPTPALV